MAKYSESPADIAAALAHRARPLVESLFPAARFDRRSATLGGIDGRPGNSLVIHLAGRRAGKWKDFQVEGERGDLLDLVARVRCNGDIGKALKWSRQFLGGAVDAPVPAPPARREESDTDLRDLALRLWRQARRIPGTPAAAYLKQRGLDGAACPSLRFLPQCKHRGTGDWMPALVARIDTADGKFLGVHRIYLTPDGSPAPVASRKRALGPVLGGSVHLAPIAPCPETGQRFLHIAEGVEDGLALVRALPGQGVWAALASSHYGEIALPPDLDGVWAAHDNDRTGHDAAEKLAARCRDAEIPVAVRPSAAKDWNEDLLALGPAAIRARLETGRDHRVNRTDGAEG